MTYKVLSNQQPAYL